MGEALTLAQLLQHLKKFKISGSKREVSGFF
jgi:hypothetical protein